MLGSSGRRPLLTKLPEVVTGGILEYLQVEFLRGCEQMVEDVGLDALVLDPVLVTAKRIDLQR